MIDLKLPKDTVTTFVLFGGFCYHVSNLASLNSLNKKNLPNLPYKSLKNHETLLSFFLVYMQIIAVSTQMIASHLFVNLHQM